MATRKQAREAVIQILYAKELGNDKAMMQAKYFLDEQKIRNKQQEFALNLLNGVCEQEYKLEKIMNVFLKTWDIDRLGVIEKNILKLGIYELQQTNTQKAVVINEAIELTKSFNVVDAFRLVNGVLDSVAKTDSTTLEQLIEEYEKAKKDKQQDTREIKIVEKSNLKSNIKNVKIKQKPTLQNFANQATQSKKTDPTHIKSVKITAKSSTKQNLSVKEIFHKSKKNNIKAKKREMDSSFQDSKKHSSLSKKYSSFSTNKTAQNNKSSTKAKENYKKDSKHTNNFSNDSNKKDSKLISKTIPKQNISATTDKQQFAYDKKETHKKD